jgi:Cd2+/Zn2+-exporting ATPase
LNGDGALVVKVSRRAGETLVARMVKLVAEAQASKSTAERAAERFTRIYVPCVLAVTVLAIVVPPLAGWLSWSEAFLRAMSMLIGASPCALPSRSRREFTAGRVRFSARNGQPRVSHRPHRRAHRHLR